MNRHELFFCLTCCGLAAGLSVLLVTGVLKWKDCLNYPPAWDTLFWFAVLVGMSGQLYIPTSCFHQHACNLSIYKLNESPPQLGLRATHTLSPPIPLPQLASPPRHTLKCPPPIPFDTALKAAFLEQCVWSKCLYAV